MRGKQSGKLFFCFVNRAVHDSVTRNQDYSARFYLIFQQSETFPQQSPCPVAFYSQSAEFSAANHAALQVLKRGDRSDHKRSDLLDAPLTNIVEMRFECQLLFFF